MAEEQVALMPQAELDEAMLAAMRAKTEPGSESITR